MKKRNIWSALIVSLVFFCQTFQLNAQPATKELKEGIKVSTEIKTAETHKYTIKLDAGRYAFLKVMQEDVDLIITTYDPDGAKIEDFDSPNGQNGAENVAISTSKTGEYRLEIRPLDPNHKTGNYTLHILKLEKAATTPEKQVDQLFTAWDNKDSPGAAVAVVRNGAIVFKKGYGMANLEYDVPIGPATVFHIASVSKQFTAFAALLLAKDGKLSLDDDVRKFVPEVPDFGKTITLRHLANHTSGLRDQWSLLAMAGWRLDDVITREHVLKLVSRQQDLNFEPGAEYMYSNTGYTLLAEVVARVSGKSFAEFTEERIFKPLKMKNTLFYDDHEKIVKNRAYSYGPRGAGYRKSVLSYANVGATSLFTTVEDLSLWALNFENPVVGDRSLMDEMKVPGVLNNGTKIAYALGQTVGSYKGLTRISHSGGDAGYRTFLGRFPDQDFSVIVFSNDGSFNSGGMAQKIADIYLKDEIAKNAPKPKPVELPASKTEVNAIMVDPETLESYVGDYELLPTFVIKVTHENGVLFAQATGQSKLILQPLSASSFIVKEVSAEVSFHKGSGSEEISLLKLNQGGAIQDAKRIKPFEPDAVNLSDFTGRFFSPELATEYVCVVENGKLVAKHSRTGDIALSPVKTNVFSGNVWYFGQIEFTRNNSKEIDGFKLTDGRVRNLRFTKVTEAVTP